ncbi:MAG: DUF285 domain-containing protein, partial [Paludibacteraceae bacterium]|nr:DUF285 domain-containing protein [Paludibacteraceae bacterium]
MQTISKTIILLLAIVFSTIANAQHKYFPKTTEELKEAINAEIAIQGDSADLNCINTSKITDMSFMFSISQFNGDISKWDVSNVTDMRGMFAYSLFNGDISNWNVSNVTNMSKMFYSSQFNGDISKWDVSNVTDMR